MDVKQIYAAVNTATQEALGQTGLVQEDLGNLVDVGTAVFNASAVDAYVKSLVNHIGRVIFVDRKYAGNQPRLLMDGWEFGSVMEKLRIATPQATENESWSLEDGASYDPNIFTRPTVAAKFYNMRTTFEVPVSFTEKQVKQSFSNAAQMNGFQSLIFNSVDRSMTIKMDELIRRTLNAMIGETIYADYGVTTLSSTSHVKARNLLYEFKQAYSSYSTLTAADAIKTPDFLRFAANEIALAMVHLRSMSSLFNIGGTDKFTPDDLMHVVLLADFAKGAETYLQSSTFHDQLVKLPGAETVPYWQGSGTDYAFGNVSKIHVTTPSNHAVEAGGILGVIFDRDACGVANLDRRVTTNYNPKAEFFNSWFKFDQGYFCDTDENFMVFFVA